MGIIVFRCNERPYFKEDDPMLRKLIGTIILLICFGSHPAVSQELSIITEDFPPFNFSKDGKLTGATTEVVQEIMRRLELKEQIQVLPWARGYKRLQTEPNVILFTAARTEEREKLFQWVGPLYAFRLGFYAPKGSGLKISSLEDAKNVSSIATYKDDFREQILQSLNFTNLDSSNSPHSNLRKLISGRVDLWFFDNIGAPKVAHEAGIDPDAIEELFEYQVNYSYIAISRETPPEIVEAWQATLDQMKADGTFWWITRKWLPANAIMVASDQAAERPSKGLRIFTEDSPPSTYMENDKLVGLSAEIVQEILRRLNLADTIKTVPWARGYNLALNEPGVLLFSTTRLPQREELFQWVGPLYTQTWGFYKHKESPLSINSMQDARNVSRIGTYRKDAKMQYLSGLGFKNLVPTNRNINNIVHLVEDDIDLWVSSDFNMEHLVQQAGVDPQKLELAYPFHKVGNYIAFSKASSPHVVRVWQQVLEEIKSDGTYNHICKKYNYHP